MNQGQEAENTALAVTMFPNKAEPIRPSVERELRKHVERLQREASFHMRSFNILATTLGATEKVIELSRRLAREASKP